MFGSLNLGHWDLFDICLLVLGIFSPVLAGNLQDIGQITL
jgi:hypothetical protein